MTPIKQKDCEVLAGTLKALGWAPVTGKVMSFDEEVGYKIGILVKVGDERLKWMEPEKKEVASDTAQCGLINFFATAHVVTKGRSMSTQPVGFTSSMAGTDMVEISPGPHESLTEFLSKVRKVSTVQVQLGLFAFEDQVEPEVRVTKAEAAAAMVKAIERVPTFSQLSSQLQTELSIEPERPAASMRP